MRDVARVAKVHPTTVSLALRNHPSLPEKTRQRIRRVAEEMGYRPNPLISALMANRRRAAGETTGAVLAFVTAWTEPDGWSRSPKYADLYTGMCRRVAELGYGIEEIWAGEPGMTGRRLTEILKARGIQGICIAPLPPFGGAGQSVLGGVAWDGLTSLALGFSLANPKLHRVSHDYFHGMTILLENVLRLGSRRPGLVFRRAVSRIADDLWTAAYLVTQRRRAEISYVEPLLYGDQRGLPGELERWIAKEQPDLLVCIVTGEIVDALDSCGIAVPGDIGLVTVDRFTPESVYAGIDQDSVGTGAAAVDQLVAALNRNERGVPPRARHLLVEGHWVDGATLPEAPR